MSTHVELDKVNLRADTDTLAKGEEVLVPEKPSHGLMFKQSVVRIGDGGTSSSSLHDAPFVLEPGVTKELEPKRSLDLNITGCNDRDSLSSGCFGSDQLVNTTCSALSGTPISTPSGADAIIQMEYGFLSSLSMLQLLSMCADRGLSTYTLKWMNCYIF
jgi:hypothetical protein